MQPSINLKTIKFDYKVRLSKERKLSKENKQTNKSFVSINVNT